MSYRDVPWSPRNRRTVPKHIKRKIAALEPGDVQVGAIFSVRREDVEAGVFNHLGMEWEGGGVSLPDRVVPPTGMGKWSERNRLGYEIVHKDQPKRTLSRSVETPNYGDWSLGSHEVRLPYEAYPRTYFPPKHTALLLDVIAQNLPEEKTEIRCRCDEVLNTSQEHFDTHLLWDINLLQENIGTSDVFSATATREDYLDTLRVHWEILPPGERERNIAVIVGRERRLDSETHEHLEERYDFLEGLSPRNWVAGTSGFARYFGAQFADDLVVFENVEYGNAAYIMGENWEGLSQLSRTELMERAELDFDRVVHAGNWKRQLRGKIRRRLRERD